MNETDHRRPVSPQHAETLRTTGFYAQSSDCFAAWLEAHPHDAWSLAHRGAALASVGDHLAAIPLFEQAISLRGGRYAWASAQKGEAHRVYLRDCIPWTPENMGPIMEELGRALAAFTVALEECPSYAWALAHKAATHTLAYFIYRNYPTLKGNATEHFDEADACFSRATELNPGYAWALAFHALLHAINDDYPRARVLMGDATVVNVGTNLHQNRALAEIDYYHEHYAGALLQGSLARRQDPEDALVLYFIAQSLKATHDPNAGAAMNLARHRLTALLNVVMTMLAGLHVASEGHDPALHASEGHPAIDFLSFLHGRQNMESLFLLKSDPVWERVFSDGGSKLCKMALKLLGADGQAEGGTK